MKRFNQIFFTVVIVLILFSAVAYGITWTENKRLTHNEGYSWSSAIAVDGPNIYVVWADNSQGNFKIFFKRSGDGGATWTKRKRLSSNSVGSEDPAIAVNGSNIYVVWHDNTPENYQIYFRKSVDGGATWKKEKRLTNNEGGSWSPAMAVDGSNIYVVWEDHTPGYRDVYFRNSVDGGTTWTKKMRLSSNEGWALWPAIAVDGSNIYVVWENHTPGNRDIYFKKSVDGGITWTENKGLSNNEGYSWYAKMAVDGSNIYVVWSDDTKGNYEIYFRKSVDGGITWTKKKRLTNNAGGSWCPSIAVDGSNIYVVWEDNTKGNYEIYFRKSVDGGITWTKNKRLTNNEGVSGLPAIAVDGPNIYVVWEDYTPGNYEIYFKAGVLF